MLFDFILSLLMFLDDLFYSEMCGRLHHGGFVLVYGFCYHFEVLLFATSAVKVIRLS